jgi:GWxTD domain-containing protein
VPVVVGYVRPVILMPVGLMTGLPAEQVEAILLHELAHMRRHDYLVNLLQTVVEGLFFYHPAVWWISRVIRAERENCCDDLVVATQGDALAYAAALTALEDHRGTVREAVLAATGGSIVTRVRRLLVPTEGPRVALTPVLSAAILTITVAAAMAAWQTSAPPRPPAPPSPPAPPAAVAPFAPPAIPAPPRLPAPPAVPARAVAAYTRWVTEDVAYIIRDDERDTFKRLQSDAEREHFIEQFWRRRDPTPDTVENEFKEEHYRRIAYANENFASSVPGWKTDRGRIYITYGPPDAKKSQASTFGPHSSRTELWLYYYLDGVRKNVWIDFVDSDGTGEYRMTDGPAAIALLRANADILKAGATVKSTIPGLVVISVPLTPYGDHEVAVYGRVFSKEPHPDHFEYHSQGPAPLYTQELQLDKGSYKFDIVVKDMATGKLAGDIVEVEVK